jgi:hypothetical protein
MNLREKTSPSMRFPLPENITVYFLPLFPWQWEHIDMREYKIINSSTYAVAKCAMPQITS